MNSNTKAKTICHVTAYIRTFRIFPTSLLGKVYYSKVVCLSVCPSVCMPCRGCCTYNVYWSLSTNVLVMYFVYHSLVLLTGLMVQLVVCKCLESVLPAWDYGETTYSHMKASQRVMGHSTFSRTIFTLTATRKKVGHEVLTCHIQ